MPRNSNLVKKLFEEMSQIKAQTDLFKKVKKRSLADNFQRSTASKTYFLRNIEMKILSTLFIGAFQSFRYELHRGINTSVLITSPKNPFQLNSNINTGLFNQPWNTLMHKQRNVILCPASRTNKYLLLGCSCCNSLNNLIRSSLSEMHTPGITKPGYQLVFWTVSRNTFSPNLLSSNPFLRLLCERKCSFVALRPSRWVI